MAGILSQARHPAEIRRAERGVPDRLKTVVVTKTVDDAELARLLEPRADDAVVERATDKNTFELDDGPFDHYRRQIAIDPQPTADGCHLITETTEFKLAIPVWGWMFVPLVVQMIKKPPAPGKHVWWLPPDRMDKRATEVLSLLCAFSALAGYLGVLLSQTNTYFKTDFAVTNTQIADLGIAVRVAAFLALFVAAFADRRGRKAVLLFSAYAAVLLAATGSIAPNLFWLGISQTLARSFSAAVAIMISIIAVEEMPAGARAFAVSVMSMTAALGAGGVVVFLFLADKAPWAWRIFFVVPLLFLVPISRLGRRVPETRRFEVYEKKEAATEARQASAHEADGDVDSGGDGDGDGDRDMGDRDGGAGGAGNVAFKRFVMLGATAFFFSIFLAPASYFLNEFLRTERGFSGGQITLLQVFTNIPGGITIIIGGRLADERGRRLIGSIGVIGGVGFTVLMYLSTSGWATWGASLLATLIGAMTIPALGVYQSELFPTGSRGRANGGLSLLGVAGAVVGLKAAGILSDPEHFGSFGPTMAVLAIGPAIVAVIVLVFYPETAHRELEELNPGDEPPPEDPQALAQLDAGWTEAHETHHHGHLGGAGSRTAGRAGEHGPPEDIFEPGDDSGPDSTGTMAPRG